MEGTSIDSQLIKYLRRMFQGSSLLVLLFIPCVNPFSYLLNNLQGYLIVKNENRNQNILHIFLVDDLKLSATNMNQTKLWLDQVNQFSNDIGIKFGQSKCSYVVVQREKVTTATEPITVNNVTINPLRREIHKNILGRTKRKLT